MRFPYLSLPTTRPVPSLSGARARYRPVFHVLLTGPLGSRLRDGCLDSASDDTIFPQFLARQVGIDLTAASQGDARLVAGVVVPYRYVAVTLRLTDGRETCEWQAIVGFADLPMRWALLGHAGFLQFFDVQLLGARREVLLTPNAAFPGQHTIHQPLSP
jgi:hypothetical protein